MTTLLQDLRFGLRTLRKSLLGRGFTRDEEKPGTRVVVSAVVGMVTVVSLLACYIPAYRASKVDPMIALRYE